MNIRVLLISLVCSLSAVCSVRAADPAPKHHDEEETELGGHMEKLGGAFKKLNREISDPAKHDEVLKYVATIKAQAEAALKLEPAKTADLPADQRPKFVEAFHKKMQGFLADVEKLEAAVKANNIDEAKKILGTLKQDSKEGHKEFQKQKDHM